MKEFVCLGCGISCSKPNKSSYKGKYCSNQCQGKKRRKDQTDLWLSGDLVGWMGKARQIKPFVRYFLQQERGTACQECGWDKRHPVDNAILTEIDHIDGDAENCHPSNLKILCPNCHSMTTTFRNRNKNSKRIRF